MSATPTSNVLRQPRQRRWIRLAFAVILIVVLAYLPLSASPFTNLQISLVAAYAVAIRGLDVLTGHAGQVSLGQAAFFGIGAYSAAYSVNHGWSVWAGLALAVAIPAIVAGLVAIPAVRLHGFAFGIITLTLPVIAVPLATKIKPVTGGSEGLGVTTLQAPTWAPLENDQWRYYVILLIAAITFLLVHNLLTGRIGRALDILRRNETVASAMGVPIQRYKVLAFVVAAICGGVGGWLYLIAVQFIAPDSLQLALSVSLLVALVVGGLRSQFGCVIGAAFYVMLPTITDKVTPGQSYLFFGVALLLVLIFFRGGIAGGVAALAGRALHLRTRHRPVDVGGIPAEVGAGDGPP